MAAASASAPFPDAAHLSPCLAEYLPAFQQEGAASDEPFLTYHRVTPDASAAGAAQSAATRPSTLTRKELWAMASRMARRLRSGHGLGKGDRVVHLFCGNCVEDVALRLAAVMLGTVPVTVNWDSDPIDRVLYKIQSSRARLVLTHDRTPPEQAAAVRAAIAAKELPAGVELLGVAELLSSEEPDAQPFLAPTEFEAGLGEEDARIIIYTSGSSGEPKGVLLPYRSYQTNRLTFESFLGLEDARLAFTPVLVNPLHHTNSTALSDWALRRPGTRLHLFERYTTGYWAAVARVALGLGKGLEEGSEAPLPADMEAAAGQVQRQVAAGVRVVCPTVSRHFDFLEALVEEGRLPMDPALLKAIAPVVTFLIGSAPVGPATVTRLLKYLGRLPTIRFGSTETCLQVMGTPNAALPEAAMLEAFRRGWERPEGEPPGFWVGRQHTPYTEVMVVRGVDPAEPSTFLQECSEGERGYLVTRGRNLMSGYVQGEEATRKAIHAAAGGWYTNLGDIGFALRNAHDGGRDVYWVTRTSNLLIRGGTNYAYDQVSAELARWACARYGLAPAPGTAGSGAAGSSGSSSLAVAAVGLRLTSEHDDDCLVTVELLDEAARARRAEIEATFVAEAQKAVSKGAKPSRVRIAAIPRNFKGDINWRQLEAEWKAEAAAAGGDAGKGTQG